MIRVQFEDGPYRGHTTVVARGERVGTELLILPSLDKVLRYRLVRAGESLHLAHLIISNTIAPRREGS